MAPALSGRELSTIPLVRPPSVAALANIPGSSGWPLVGNTLEVLADPKGMAVRYARKFGPVYRTYTLGAHTVTLLGPEANEFFLLDQAKAFSSALGWGKILERLFPRGLMLLDFDEHRLHRKALSVAFKAGPMKSYLGALDRGFSQAVRKWIAKSSALRFYPEIKEITLELASVSFLGTSVGTEMEATKQAYVDMMAAAVAPVRSPLPGTQMRRGVKARQFMVDYFKSQIPIRRAGEGDDLFSQLCKATTDDGVLLSPQDIADHMNFLMMAAHDTLASSLTSFVYFLAKDKEWREKLREEMRALGLAKGEPLPFERLQELPLTEMAFNEAIRLIPPAPSILRCAIRDVVFAGFRIPAGAYVNINPLYTQRMPEHWPDPERFDPMRFTAEAARARHKYAFTPFGGGAHMCLGLHFAYMQAKCFAYHLLSVADFSVESHYRPEWRYWPIPQPRDGLRVNFSPI